MVALVVGGALRFYHCSDVRGQRRSKQKRQMRREVNSKVIYTVLERLYCAAAEPPLLIDCSFAG